jgi:hypothetical protein
LALHWFMAAAEHDGGEPMIEEVRHWRSEAAARGIHLREVEDFVCRTDIRDRYRRYGGRELA